MGTFLNTKTTFGKMKSKSDESKGFYNELSLGNRRPNHISDMQNIERTLGKY